jgi:hypothetical protein
MTSSTISRDTYSGMVWVRGLIIIVDMTISTNRAGIAVTIRVTGTAIQ